MLAEQSDNHISVDNDWDKGLRQNSTSTLFDENSIPTLWPEARASQRENRHVRHSKRKVLGDNTRRLYGL